MIARPESWGYRTGKFLRRNAWATTAAALAVITIGSLVTFYTLQLQREREQLARESATAEEVSAFLVGLFEEANPARARPDVLARQVLEDGVARINDLRSTAAAGRGASHALHGARLFRPWLLRARPRTARRGTGHPAQSCCRPVIRPIAEALHHLGVVQTELRDHDASLATLTEALRLREAALGADAAPVGETLYRIGVLQHRRGDYVAMGVALKRATAIYEKSHGPDAPTLAELS